MSSPGERYEPLRERDLGVEQTQPLRVGALALALGARLGIDEPWPDEHGFAFAIFERSGLRELRAWKLEARQVDARCDRCNVFAG